MTVDRIISDDEMLVFGRKLWIKGLSTSGLAVGSTIEVKGIFLVDGLRTYKDNSGKEWRVPYLLPVNDQKVERLLDYEEVRKWVNADVAYQQAKADSTRKAEAERGKRALASLTAEEKKYAIEHIRSGGKIPEKIVGPERLDSKLSSLPTGFYGFLSFRGGAEVRQIINAREMLACGRGAEQRAQGDFWIEGVSTADLVDGSLIDLSKTVLMVAGTKTYTTVSGGRATVKRFVVVNTKNVEKVLADPALRQQLMQQAGDR
jgi:hypothetical protein